MVWVSAKLAVAVPLFVTVIVQLNELFTATLPLTLLDFVTARSGWIPVYEAVSVSEFVSVLSTVAVFVIFVPSTAVIEQV